MELRTHNCGELRQSDEGKHVKLCGWLSSVRDLGAVIFFVLRDYYGYTQAVVTDEDKKSKSALSLAKALYPLRVKWCFAVRQTKKCLRV